MICKKCGNEVEEGQKFCGVCGADLQQENTEAVSEVTEETGEEAAASEQFAPKEDIFAPAQQPKKKKTGIVLGVVIAVCAVAAAAVVMLGSSPERVVVNALANTAKVMAERDNVYKNIFSTLDSEFLATGSKEQGIYLQIDDYADEPMVNGVGISADVKLDMTNKMGTMDYGITYQGMELAQANVYADEENIYGRVPVLYDSWFKFGNKNILEQYANSAFNSEGYFEYDPEEDFDIDVFADNGLTSFYNNYVKNTAVLLQNISYEKTDDAKTINNLNCKGYLVTISGDDIKNYVLSLAEGLNEPENELIKHYVLTSAEMNYDELIETVENADFEDAKVKLYINKNVIYGGEVTVIPVMNPDKTIGINWEYNDKELLVVILDDDEECVTYTNSVENSNGTITQTDNFVVNGEDAVVNIYSQLSSEGDLNVNVQVGDSYNGCEINAEGSVIKDVNSLNVDFDTVEYSDYEGNGATFSFGGYVNELTDKISEPAEDAVAVFEASEETLEGIMDEIKENAYSLVMTLSRLG